MLVKDIQQQTRKIIIFHENFQLFEGGKRKIKIPLNDPVTRTRTARFSHARSDD